MKTVAAYCDLLASLKQFNANYLPLVECEVAPADEIVCCLDSKKFNGFPSFLLELLVTLTFKFTLTFILTFIGLPEFA
jgi:hypothetical protein